MPTPVYRTALFLCQLVQRLPIGTNLAIAHLLFTLLAGHLLQSRGALFPALAATGLTDSQVRGAEGKWSITYLLKRLNWLLEKEGKGVTHQINSWQPMPRIRHWKSLNLCRPSSQHRYTHIEMLFNE